MKKMIVSLMCFLLLAPFALAAESVTSPGQGGAVLIAQDQDRTQTQLQDQTRDQQRDRVQDQVTPDDPDYVSAMHQYQFRNENVMRIQNMIRDAQLKGLPTEPLQDKVHEGIAKKAGQENIVRAVAQVQSRYENGYRHARGLFAEPEQVANLGNRFAEAHAAGLANEDAEKLMAQLQNRTRTMNREQAYQLAEETITAARNVARQGVTSGTVADIFIKALQHSYKARDMQTLQHSFASQARHGNPESIAQGYAQGISQGVGAGGLGAAADAGGAGGAGGDCRAGIRCALGAPARPGAGPAPGVRVNRVQVVGGLNVY